MIAHSTSPVNQKSETQFGQSITSSLDIINSGELNEVTSNSFELSGSKFINTCSGKVSTVNKVQK